MKKSSSKVESEEHAKYLALIQQFKNLEKQWKSLQKPKPRNPRTCSISSHNSNITSFDQLLENSPRELLFSLQKSPSYQVMRVRTRNMAVEEILRDRRAAIMSGKLKGRRLFGAAAEESDMSYGGGGGEVFSDWLNDTIQEKEHELPVAFNQSCSFSDSSPSEEKVVVEEKKMVEEVVSAAEKRDGDRRLSGGGGCMVPRAWFAVVLILITLGLVSMSCKGKYVQRNELILVPT